MLVEGARLGVALVDHEHRARVALGGAGLDERVDVIAVLAHRAPDVAVVMLERVFPGLAVLIDTAAGAPLRVLDADVQAGELDAPDLVVAGLLLAVGGLWQIVGRAGGRAVGTLVDGRAQQRAGVQRGVGGRLGWWGSSGVCRLGGCSSSGGSGGRPGVSGRGHCAAECLIQALHLHIGDGPAEQAAAVQRVDGACQIARHVISRLGPRACANGLHGLR